MSLGSVQIGELATVINGYAFTAILGESQKR